MLLYHLVPTELVGTKLYPLNDLKSFHLDLYERARTKYIGREAVMQQIIPLLDCLWNDVIFLSPVHPEKILHARISFGLQGNYDKKSPWFVLESENLDQSKLILYRHRPKWLADQEQDKAEYLPFVEVSQFEKEQLTEIPECALWSIQKFREKSLFQSYVPHLLYKGVIDITNASIVTC